MRVETKVYCPCKRACSDYSGSNRRCTRVGRYESMPQEFIQHRMSQQEGLLGKILMGAVDTFTPTIHFRMGSRASYEVWQCPGCKCKVLVQITRNGNGTEMEEIEAISRCRG